MSEKRNHYFLFFLFFLFFFLKTDGLLGHIKNFVDKPIFHRVTLTLNHLLPEYIQKSKSRRDFVNLGDGVNIK